MMDVSGKISSHVTQTELQSSPESHATTASITGASSINQSARALRSSDNGAELLEFLLDPSSYPHRPSWVRMIQTHASFVFIAPPFVYKVKKPVNYGFLDYSTLDKRRHLCAREVVLNARLCPGFYLGVAPITAGPSGLAFGAGGRVVEYAVKMRRLPERFFLDRMVQRGAIQPVDLDRVIATLKRFYLAQIPTREIEEWGRVDRLKISTDENFKQTEAFIGRTITRVALEAIRSYTNTFYERHAALFDSRVTGRWIRDCHGDLHLEHVHLTPRAVHIYDCIEFNDRFRYVDVANDVAFLAMDLDYRRRPDLAGHFAKGMAVALADPHMMQLLDFYKCYRAYVRGKVESFASLVPAASETTHEAATAQARRYFQLALQYPVAGSQPRVLAVMGRIGTGKSSLARALGKELDWPVFSSDRVRKEFAGLVPSTRTRPEQRPGLYSQPMTEKTHDALLSRALTEIANGRNVILDATFGRAGQRERLKSGLHGCALRFVELQTGDETIKCRLASRDSDPCEISDARLEDFDALSRAYESPDELGPGERIVVSSGRTVDDTLAVVLATLVRERA